MAVTLSPVHNGLGRELSDRNCSDNRRREQKVFIVHVVYPVVIPSHQTQRLSSCSAEQFHIDASLEAVDRQASNNSKKWQWMTEAQHMQLLPWPAYLPDMSPIENVWDLVVQRLACDPCPAASKDELFLRIRAIWNSLPQVDIQNLFDSMPRRIAALIAARGGYTKY
ncbi:transposable element Tcb1 transposase [Trichonephila clavipes]|nr:transposable element Tcb1 transposase [Trichonephila clavipes]